MKTLIIRKKNGIADLCLVETEKKFLAPKLNQQLHGREAIEICSHWKEKTFLQVQKSIPEETIIVYLDLYGNYA